MSVLCEGWEIEQQLGLSLLSPGSIPDTTLLLKD